ncbi:MAG: C45 family peptidase [Thermoguttaceae bacterium]
MRRFRLLCLVVFAAIAWSLAAGVRADDVRAFQERRSGPAELKYINGLPVLCVEGTPKEMGRQKADLIGDVVGRIIEYPQRLLKQSGHEDRLPKYLEMSKAIGANIPAAHRAEMLAFAERSGVDREMGILGNTLADVYRGSFSCSSLIVEPEKSATGGPLFGRNLDFYTLGLLDRYSLVVVQRPKGKHAFAAVGFPGLFGCLSGINDAGLALAVHEVFLSRDGSPVVNPKGVPYAFCFRRMLEECATIQEAEKLLRSTERSTIVSLAVCDRHNSIVLEMTPRSVATRRSSDSILACTNHFRTDELAFMPWCNRYRKLIQARKLDQLDVAEVARRMDEVNRGRMTVQTMIFEPSALTLHLAIGRCPSSALPMKRLELGPLFSPQR